MGKRGASVTPPPPNPNRQEESSGRVAYASMSSRTPGSGSRKSQPPGARKSQPPGARKSQPPGARKSVPPPFQAAGPMTTRPPKQGVANAAHAPAAHAPKKPSRAPLPGSRQSAPPPQSNPMVPGRIVGRYKLLVPIGAGGMAQVWAARPETAGLARTVAIKLVLPDYAADSEYERMFVDE